MNDRYKNYMKDYNKVNRVRISLNLSKDTDKDILQAIDQAKNKQGNIQAGVKSLIRKGIKYEEIIKQ